LPINGNLSLTFSQITTIWEFILPDGKLILPVYSHLSPERLTQQYPNLAEFNLSPEQKHQFRQGRLCGDVKTANHPDSA